MKIVFKQFRDRDEDGSCSETECNMCSKKKFCKYRESLEDLVLPSRFTIEFECGHFTKSNPR